MTNKTVSTRVDDNIYNSLIDYSNQQGKTISQIIHHLVTDTLEANKEFLNDSSQCSIDSDDDEKSTTSSIFSQDRPLEGELMSLQHKKTQKTISQNQILKVKVQMGELDERIENLMAFCDKKLKEIVMKTEIPCSKKTSCIIS